MNHVNHDIVGRGWGFPPQIDRRGGVELVGGLDEINQAIRIILSTAVGERVMRPEFGSRLHELVFAPLNETTFALARRYVEDALTMWEPRIELKQVSVALAAPARWLEPSPAGMLSIEVQYAIKFTGDQRSLVFPFYSITEE